MFYILHLGGKNFLKSNDTLFFTFQWEKYKTVWWLHCSGTPGYAAGECNLIGLYGGILAIKWNKKCTYPLKHPFHPEMYPTYI